MPALRSIIALVGGFAIMAFLMFALVAIAAWIIGARAGDQYSPAMLGATIGLFAIAALAGGYATASLAPGRPRLHATVLAAMVLAMTISMISSPQPGAPRWFSVTLALIGPIFAVLGGVFRRQRSSSPVPT
jgi:Kef-type K+ transport system membrane component KefB